MTAAEARLAQAASLEGSLREMPLADVLQLLELGRKSGALHVEEARTGRLLVLHVLDGRIVRAGGASDRRGIVDAVCDALAWSSGRFAVGALPTDARVDRRAGVALDAVLLEAAHRADEWARLGDRVAGPDARPALDVLPAGDLVALTPDQWRILAVADGVDDLRALAARLGVDVLAVARDVHAMLALGALRLVVDDGAVPTGAARSSE